MPYSVGLVAVGIGLPLLPLHLDIPLTRGPVFYALVPPLIFETAFYNSWKELKADLPVIITFATLGLSAFTRGRTGSGTTDGHGWTVKNVVEDGVLGIQRECTKERRRWARTSSD